MRVTNGMIRQTSLNSLHKNMNSMNTLFNQMNTLKKIQRPSDDPIVAGRSMKLKINVMESEQHQSNVDEATAWMGVTEAALGNMTEILKEIRTKSTQAANGTLTVDDKQKLQADIEQLTAQLKQEANVTYAGRYVFSGHKTDKPIFLTENQTADTALTGKINEYLKNQSLDISGDVTLGDKLTLKGDMTLGGDVQLGGVMKVVGDTTLGGNVKLGDTDTTFNNPVKLTHDVTIAGTAYKAGDVIPAGTAIPKGSIIAKGTIIKGGDELPKGSILEAGTKLQATTEIPKGSIVKQGNTVNKGETLPEGTVLGAGNINFGVVGQIDGQNINYEIGVGTTINVNTLGIDKLATDIIRDLNQITQAVSGDMSDEALSRFFSNKIKDVDGRLNTVSEMTADLGSRENRLNYTKERLKEDTANFTELLTNTEDVDLEDTYVQFNAQNMVYTSALQATSKVIMNSLADFLK